MSKEVSIKCLVLAIAVAGLFFLLFPNGDRMVASREAKHSTFATSATRCADLAGKTTGALLHSQQGEDRVLLQYFDGMCGGRYIELGALDGDRFSNTLAFNRGPLQWKGVLIEPNPITYVALQQNRSDELLTVNSAICSTPHEVEFYYHGKDNAVGAILEFATKQHQQYVKSVRFEHKNITCEPLQDIIQRSGENYFDFFSLDVEGAELEVLKTIDFSKTGFGVILIEGVAHRSAKDMAVQTFVEQQGYRYTREHKGSLWFVNPRFHDIYSHLL